MSLCLPPSTPHRFYTHLLSIHTHTIFNLGSITPCMGFPGGSDGEESTCNVGDLSSIPGLGRSPGGGHGNPLHCSCLEDPHGQRSLAGYSRQGHKESGTTERLSTALPPIPLIAAKTAWAVGWAGWTDTYFPLPFCVGWKTFCLFIFLCIKLVILTKEKIII